jgi:hypothetical protein
VYENPTLSRRNALISASASDVWVPNHHSRRIRDQATAPEMEARHVPSEVRVVTNDADRAERVVPSVSTGSETNWYSAAAEHEDASIVTDLDRFVETTRPRPVVVSPQRDHHTNDGSFPVNVTSDPGVVLAMRVISDRMTEQNVPVNGATFERLFAGIDLSDD